LWNDCIQEETHGEALGGPQEDGDVENLALASQARKGKGKVRMNTGGDSSSQASTGKELSKVNCFHCHKKGHYASQCLERKKGGNKMQPYVAASTRAQAMSLPRSLNRHSSYLFPDFLGHHISWCMANR
jgi:hypothetical protein